MAEERQTVYEEGGSSTAARRRGLGLSLAVSTGEAPSSRRRSSVAVWPEHFVESVAVQVAVDAALSEGRLAAGPAIANFFQVYSTWRQISHSEMLWQDLTNRVWSHHHRHFPSWRAEFIQLHRTAQNFRMHRSVHSRLLAPTYPARSCCCLSISDAYLAAGFLDGNVCVFTLPNGAPIANFSCHPSRDRLGRFSQCVSGLAFLSNPNRVVFAYRDGDVHVGLLNDGPLGTSHRAHAGDLVVDGPLLDFTGNDQCWVGLFAGAPGRSWHVWDANTEQLIYVGGSLTDAGALMGWHMLTDFGAPVVGRVRLAGPGMAVGCSSSRIQVMDLENPGFVINELVLQQGELAVDSVDATSEGRIVYVDLNGLAKVCRVPVLDEVCSFDALRRDMQGQHHGEVARVVACMNWGYVICFSSWAGVWDSHTGEFLYRFRERIGHVVAAVVNNRNVAAWSDDSGLHLWDFGAM
ncbi:hypothetical protein LUZ63_014419 [Rhynchospora breviuscula]|uniref:Transcriptional regulator STERILE APETALA n=1 Tax=Rhynchospora breviuscula TaxID=2022672 RepID=A0A9Q0CAC8_9POAL|nr:hypothetical protein LUZ63_014419 [Rhynchospora breviuscula]